MINQVLLLRPNLILALLVFMLFYLATKGVRTVIARFTKSHRHRQDLTIVLGRMVRWIVLLIGLFVSLFIVVPSFQAKDLIQLLGVSSIVIGFAFRDIFQNFLAGILLLTEPFRRPTSAARTISIPSLFAFGRWHSLSNLCIPRCVLSCATGRRYIAVVRT